MAASWPTSAKTFTTRVDGVDVASAADINAANDEIAALEADLIAGWTTPTFDAANFAGNGAMTWTVASGGTTTYAYKKIGKYLTVSFYISGTTVAGTPDPALLVKIPGGYSAAKWTSAVVRVIDNSTAAFGYAETNVSSPSAALWIYLYCDATGTKNWSASTSATSVAGEITFEVS